MNKYNEGQCYTMAVAWVNAYVDCSPGGLDWSMWVDRVQRDLMTQLNVDDITDEYQSD